MAALCQWRERWLALSGTYSEERFTCRHRGQRCVWSRNGGCGAACWVKGSGFRAIELFKFFRSGTCQGGQHATSPRNHLDVSKRFLKRVDMVSHLFVYSLFAICAASTLPLPTGCA
jgi:hypothetical protein